MKYLLHLFILLLLSNCQRAKPISYEEGLSRCLQLQEQKHAANPNAFQMETADCMIGAQIPDFEETTLEGVKMNRKLLMGKPTLLNFWFTTCAPCVAEIPGFNAIVQKFGVEKMNYVAIGRDNREDIQEFLQKTPWSFTQISNDNDLIQHTFKMHWGYPTTFLLNKNAEIVLVFSGGKTDSTAVEEVQKKLIPAIEKELR